MIAPMREYDRIDVLPDQHCACRAAPPRRRRAPSGHAFIASTPPMISDSSVVIWLWRARLYCMVRLLTILSALSVADFIDTMRATFSLVVASRKHWNSDV